MVSSVLRRRLLIGAGVVVAVPCLTVVGASGYIYYRSLTKPPDHQFRALVMANGMLDLPDCNIPQPTKWEIFIRIVELVRVFLPLVVYYYLFGYRDEHYDWWLHKLLAAVEAAGPAFVKAGQWSCTRNDLFSPHFRKVFTKLYSEVSIHPFAETRRMIETETGKKVEEIFSSLEEMPVGSGSIGQVHRGVLRENNRQVAVKIMHPRVVEQIARDFFVINLMATWADKHFKSLEHLELPVQSFAWTNHLAAQIDFRVEFEHLELMRKNFAGTNYARIPEPIQATQRVLIEEFLPGEPATPEFLRSLPAHSRDILAAKGLNGYCKMLLRDNFIHGDMHPGNILVDARDVNHPQFALIDVGLCVKLSHVEGNRSNDLMSAFVKWDGALCRDTLLAMGRHQKYCDTELFKTEVDDLFNRYRPISGNEEGVVENIMQSLFEATRRARVTMDPGYVNLMVSVLVLEGFVMALNPEYNVVKHAAPWLVGDGHLSTTLVKNIFLSGLDHVRVRASEWKARLTGELPDPNSPYQPKRRPRFDVEQGRAVSQEELALRLNSTAATS